MTPEDFVAKWKRVGVKESVAAQIHFNELCDLLGVDKPLDVDPEGEFYTFEKSIGKEDYADVWYKEYFAWDYKSAWKRGLEAAYGQLLTYREDLGNPPLLIVSDVDTIEIHTNFMTIQKHVRRFTLDELLNPEKRRLLKEAWKNPEAFKAPEMMDRPLIWHLRALGAWCFRAPFQIIRALFRFYFWCLRILGSALAVAAAFGLLVGWFPLHFAVVLGSPVAVNTLISIGGDVNAQSRLGDTPLHLATEYNPNPTVITLLLDAGADATARDNEGKTPWDHAQDNEALRGTDAWWRLREGGLD